MSDNDVRTLLLDGTGKLKYELLELDAEHALGQAPANEAVDAVVKRAQGLPLYVHHVVQDILAGHFRFKDLAQRLPPGLDAYYDDLLGRMAIGDLQALLTPLVVTICWAREPLDEETLHLLMERRRVIATGPEGLRILRQALERTQSMLRLAPLPRDTGIGHEPYHPTFREHVQEDRSGQLGQQNALAQGEFCELARDWARLPAGSAALRYALRNGPVTLVEAGRAEDATRLLLDLCFLETKAAAGMVFDLVRDFVVTAQSLPEADSRRRVLLLLEEALRRDVHFIEFVMPKYPPALFQSLWNTCWWHDRKAAVPEPVSPARDEATEISHADEPPLRLSTLMERWRAARDAANPGVCWARSLLPPLSSLGRAQRAIFRGHDGRVNSVAFTPDGRRLISGGSDKTVRVWDVESGAELRCIRGHERSVLGIACSPDGTRVFSVSPDETLRSWDLMTGAELRSLRKLVGHQAAMSADDWEVREYLEERRWERNEIYGLDEGLYCVAVSGDGRLVAAGSRCWVVHLWNVSAGGPARELSHSEEWIHGVAFSPDRSRLAYCGGNLSVVELTSEREVFQRDLNFHAASSVAYSPSGKLLASGGSRDSTILLWDAETGEEAGALGAGEGGGVTSIAFSPDGRRIVSGSRDTLVRMWDIETGELLGTFVGHEDEVTSVAITPAGDWIASSAADGSVRLWDSGGAGTEERDVGHHGGVTTVDISPDGRTAASGGEDSRVRLWDVRTGNCSGIFDFKGGRVKQLGFSADGRWVAVTYEESPCNDMRIPTDFIDVHRGVIIANRSVPEQQDNVRDLEQINSRLCAPFVLRRSGPATALLQHGRDDPVAWLPLPLTDHAVSANGLVHVAAVGNHVLIFTLEAGPPSPEQIGGSEGAFSQSHGEDIPF